MGQNWDHGFPCIELKYSRTLQPLIFSKVEELYSVFLRLFCWIKEQFSEKNAVLIIFVGIYIDTYSDKKIFIFIDSTYFNGFFCFVLQKKAFQIPREE